MKIPTALYLQEQHDVECGGRHIQYFIATFLAKPYPIEPTLGDLHDYRKCKGCQETNKEIVRQLKVKFDKFPFCCQWHQKLLSINEFNKLYVDIIGYQLFVVNTVEKWMCFLLAYGRKPRFNVFNLILQEKCEFEVAK